MSIHEAELQAIEAGYPDVYAELTRLRAREAVLVKQLAEAIELIEREVCSTASQTYRPPKPYKTLGGEDRHWPGKSYDIDAMREALATLDVEEKM